MIIDKTLLEHLACSNVSDRQSDTLQDILKVEISGETAHQRLESFLSQVGNPYCFRVGKTPVRISFSAVLFHEFESLIILPGYAIVISL